MESSTQLTFIALSKEERETKDLCGHCDQLHLDSRRSTSPLSPVIRIFRPHMLEPLRVHAASAAGVDKAMEVEEATTALALLLALT